MRRNYFWYQFLRFGVISPALHLFYSDITVEGSKHIPKNKPVLFIANHQNALMDALHVVVNTNRFVHFLTRADPFEIPLMEPILKSLNMLPVYRRRDGYGTIRKNHEIFEECFDRLAENDAILIFAEADHDLKRRVRPLSKGFTRIAFGAEQQNGWKLGVQVVPVGINYGRHQKSRTPVHISFGETIAAADYKSIYKNDKRQAARQLHRDTEERLKKLTMHVPSLEYYPVYRLLLDELEVDRQSVIHPSTANHNVSKISDTKISDKTSKKASKLLNAVNANGINLRDFVFPVQFKTKDLLLSPFYLFSLLNNALPYQAVRWVKDHYLEDHVFDATAKFVLGLLLLPSYYLIVSFALGWWGISLPVAGAYYAISIITAPMFVRAKDLITSDAAKRLKKKKPEIYSGIQSKWKYFQKLRNQLLQ